MEDIEKIIKPDPEICSKLVKSYIDAVSGTNVGFDVRVNCFFTCRTE
ncbi:MAG TPA: hypothetical protein VIK78_22355 [Ruminiclostridium sp.]